MTLFERLDSFFDAPLGWTPRILLVIAVVISVMGFTKPLWQMEFEAQMYKDPPLRMNIFLDHLEGGEVENRDDLKEINSLNKYIGMQQINEEDFLEFLWLPLGLGLVLIVLLRAAVLGEVRNLVDAFVVFAYYGGVSFYSFYRWMYSYGHDLDPTAAIEVEPFMPPMFGTEKIQNFTVTSVPGDGAWYLTAGAVLTFIAVLAATYGYYKRRGSERRETEAS